MLRDWANLPPELLQIITDELPDIFDCIRFRRVCRNWRSSIGTNDIHPRIPWLFLSNPNENLVCFLNPSTYTVHNIPLPGAQGNLLFGSLHGWLILINHDQQDTASVVTLLNPITRAQITLPQIPKLSTACNAILCFNPAIPQPNDLMVVIWSGSTIFFIRHGDDAWVEIKAPFENYGRMVYFNRRVYVMDGSGKLAVINVGSSRLDPLVSEELPGDCLLVQHEEVTGNLSLIRWWRETEKIEVYKLDMSAREMQWPRAADDIDDYELYMAHRQCISIACPRDSPTRRKHKGYYSGSIYEYKEDGEFDERVNLDHAIPVSSYRSTWMLPSLQ